MKIKDAIEREREIEEMRMDKWRVARLSILRMVGTLIDNPTRSALDEIVGACTVGRSWVWFAWFS